MAKCYNCKFRGTVPGSAHSSCRVIRETTSDVPKAAELEILLASHQVQITGKESGEPLVKINEHGAKNGWANWPLDFDPIWVDDCRFFLDKEEADSRHGGETGG
jgi:hypothetical protein